jgi:hypothetical protein
MSYHCAKHGWTHLITSCPSCIGYTITSTAEVAAQKAECERLKEALKYLPTFKDQLNLYYANSNILADSNKALENKNAALVTENTDFRAALEFYAKERNWITPGMGSDQGENARAVLSKHDKKESP